MWLRRGLILVAVVGAVACSTFDFPSETCDPSSLDAKLDPGNDDGNCSRCLEDHCCDIVGRCQAQPLCPQIVHDAHKCVLDAGLQGAAEEKSCTADPLHDIASVPEAQDAYRCMRSSCGTDCSLPVCQLDQAAILVRNAKCDACFSGACCTPLNSCYADRACKLMLECMVDECGSVLGPSLADGGIMVPDASAPDGGGIDALCAGPPTALPTCIQNCFCRYRDNDEGLPPTDPANLSFNLAESVYTCGKEANCGADCTPGPDEAGAP